MPSFPNDDLKDAAQIMHDDVDIIADLLEEMKMIKIQYSQSLVISRAEGSIFHHDSSTDEDYQMIDYSAVNAHARNQSMSSPFRTTHGVVSSCI